jgi:hypothetical protein
MVKSLLIDPSTASVTEVEVNSLADMREHVGSTLMKAQSFGIEDTLYIGTGNQMQPHRFRIAQSVIFSGKGLLIGPPDEEGYDTDVKITAQRILGAITWIGYDPAAVKEAGAEFGAATGHDIHIPQE